MDVQITGLADPETFPTNPTMFTELALADILVVPEAKPPIEQLMTVNVEVIIDSVRVVRTPSGRSLAGQILRGAKVVVEGTIKQGILYVADMPDQPVHGFDGSLPFSTFIVVPSKIDGVSITELIPAIGVAPFVEDVYARLVSPRKVFKNVVLFLNVTLAPTLEVQPKPCCDLEPKPRHHERRDLKA